ncbi:PEP-CTERM sorting domain-containing protein [Nitrosomonas sp.]|uniref:PEP-CTERM sorting domain-containing protein n=1 Tax=Nitrosomonas sp. TaxID=42353 RepID=UPI001DAC254D|nr:PEP-CTERM sorting domain-containing protein [Nitrosomonas sp.]MBX3616635.1 PEP-CTERM sorting domain-containing protein [Nitrosomonas sp.]
MNKLKSTVIAAAITTIFAAPASAAVTIFSDNFDSYSPLTLNWTPPVASGWTVSSGTVDLIGTGFNDILPGNGNYIDLDGSTSNSGVFANSVNLISGVTYTLSFDLAGSQRGSTETVDINFGTASTSVTLGGSAPLTAYDLSFTPSASGVYGFSFENLGGDNVGLLLDNVSVSAVPEPETYAMLLAGLGMLGFMLRSRKTNA